MTAVESEPLSGVDAAWLHMEDPTNLMMVAGVLCFDEPIAFEKLLSVIGRTPSHVFEVSATRRRAMAPSRLASMGR